MLSLYQKTKQFVINSFQKIGKNQIIHFEKTVFWLQKIRPRADEALLIAAIAHDIERAFRKKDMHEKIKLGLDNTDFLKSHQERGAKIIESFLKKQGANPNLTAKVKMLIEKHEEGGNIDQNLLKDADSVSFFENNIGVFLTKHTKELGIEKVEKKFKWMYQRITSKKAKQIAKPWYNKALQDLKNK